MHIPRFIAALTVTAVLALGAGCDESTSPSGNSVSVEDDVFDPSSLTTGVGATVTWTWAGMNQHNVTWVDQAGPASSPTQTTGTYTRTFNDTGSFEYYCTIHGTPTSGMRGSVTVQ